MIKMSNTRKRKSNKHDYTNLCSRLIKSMPKNTKMPMNPSQSAASEVTPNTIAFSLMKEMFGIDDAGKFEQFSRELTERLASLMTSGEDPALFGNSLDQLVQSLVISLNMLGKVKRFLDEKGIEFDGFSGIS